VDRAILAMLEEDGRISNADLVDHVGLSPSPCLRRVNRLEEAGVIRSSRLTGCQRCNGHRASRQSVYGLRLDEPARAKRERSTR
jgi:Lrp/AsnC family leucine-responsive transcriptional regulator